MGRVPGTTGIPCWTKSVCPMSKSPELNTSANSVIRLAKSCPWDLSQFAAAASYR